MANTIDLDFTDAPPSSGGGGMSDHVKPGRYTFKIAEADTSTTKTGKPMVTVCFLVDDGGEFHGRKVYERFVIRRPGTDDTAVGLQRFHGLLVALGSPVLTNKKVKGFALDKIKGKRCLIEVSDEEVEAKDGYDARLTSRAMQFFSLKSADTEASTPAPTPEPVLVTPAPTPAPEPSETVVDLDADEVGTTIDSLFDD